MCVKRLYPPCEPVFECWAGRLQQHRSWKLPPGWWHSAVLPSALCTHGACLRLFVCALQTSRLPLVHGAAQKGQVGFSVRGGRCWLSRGDGVDGVSLIPDVVLQKTLCLLLVSFPGCCTMRVQVSESHVRREKPQLFC